MRKRLLLFFLAAASALHAAPQSGRKVNIPRPPVHIAPVQVPINSEPEPERRAAVAPARLSFLPETLREREIRTIASGSFRLADFPGKVLVINIWASWCGPCRREMPEYERVRKAYAGRDVEFIGLTTEDPRVSSEQVNRFLRDVNFGFRLGWADRETARTLMNGSGAIPQTVVFNAEGRVVTHLIGYAPGSNGPRLRQSIDDALKAGKGL